MMKWLAGGVWVWVVVLALLAVGCEEGADFEWGAGAGGGEGWTAPDGMIRVVTYNLGNYVLMDRDEDGAEDDPKPEEEIEALLDLLVEVKPDVLAVQEIGSEESGFRDLQRRLKARGLNLVHADLGQGSDSVRHVGILSRFPLRKVSDHVDATFRLSGERLHTSRAIQEVLVEVGPDYSLRLINVHLKSKRAHPLGEQAMRNAEARVVREAVEAVLAANPNENLMVLGDFNDTKNTTPLEIIRGDSGPGVKLADVWARDDRRETWTQNWRYQDIYSRFDFALFSPGLRPEIIERGCFLPANTETVWRASDHRPVVVAILPVEGGRGR
ncbi:MAG: endonuclease/exonuclease/phosphatase family protein [Verrucomicrobiota bacterium]|nr:endonuclease/exonuclease/phosphatase family protein [Verrucomicrobiota bacterium]